MKYLYLSVALASLGISGCGSMVYGNENAPVVDRNIFYGQTIASGGQNVPPQNIPPNNGGVFSNVASAGQPVPPPTAQVPRNVAANPVRPPAYPTNPTQPASPPVNNNQPANNPLVLNTPQTQTQVQAANPYQPAAPNIKGSTATVGGGAVPVDQPKVQQEASKEVAAVRDAVKEAPKVSVAEPNTSKRQALRPNTNAQPTAETTGSAPQPVAENRTVASAQEPAADKPAQGETAVSALLKKASGSLGKGDLDGAAAYLENAQRLDPKNSKILYDIANIRYHQGRYKESESMASRAVQTGGSNAMLKKSWSLISNSRNKLGDSQGAVQAATKAASY
ncbi:MAG: tetratricopeptide repeat protein [Cardiobacteriaceae bacterium]|nr:tetratricopeptide repeat protein [Cardiobacteriaceae bacterium]